MIIKMLENNDRFLINLNESLHNRNRANVQIYIDIKRVDSDL